MAQSLNMTPHQFLLSLIKENINSSQSIEMYTDEDIAQWTQADQLSTEQKQYILKNLGM